MRRRRIALNLAATVYDKALIAGVQLAMVPLLAKAWGLHLYGCWVVLATLPGFLALADLGFGGAAFVRMTAMVARGDRDGAVRVLHTALQFMAVACLAMSAVVLTAIWAVPDGWLPTDAALPPVAARGIVLMLFGYALLLFLGSLQAGGLVSVGQFPLYTLVNTHAFVLENALVAAAVLLGHGPVLAAAGLLSGRLLTIAVLGILLRRRAPWLRFGFRYASGAERRSLAPSAAGMMAVPLSQALALQGGVLALGVAAGPAATPAFAAARTLSRIGLQAIQLLTHALMPEFTAAQGRGDGRGQAAMLLAVVAAAIAAALPFAGVIGFGGEWLLRLWTGGAVTATPGLMPAMALVVLMGGLWNPLSSLMCAVDRQNAFVWAYLGAGTLSLLVTLSLGRTLGATGAALALAGLDAAMCVVVGRFAWRHWLHGLPTRDVARAAWSRGRALFGG